MKNNRMVALWILMVVAVITISGCASWQTTDDTSASYPPPSDSGGHHH